MKKAFSKLAGLLAVVLLLTVLPMTASAAETTLSFTAPEGVTFQLYAAQKNFGSTTGTKVSATSAATADGITTYSYVGLAAGNYYYTASGDGYYNVKKNVYYSEAEAAVGGTIDANPGKLAAGGEFEPHGSIVVNDHTDELNAAANQSAKDAWPGYEQIFDTPYFTRSDYAERMTTGNGKHQQTTQEEMMAFLDEVDDENDDVYTYILGQSPVYNYDIPILIFTKTDLSGAETLEEAAELVRGNGKLTFHISAEVHSDEPASGEMALAIIDELDKEYGQELMETINIYVIPRINPDGAREYVRTNVSQGIDMNRDYMYAQSEEVEMILYAKNLFMAEVAVDEHEFNVHDHQQPTNGWQHLPDIYIGQSGSQNNPGATNDLVDEVIAEVFDAGSEKGIRPYYYPPYTTPQYTRGRGYYSLDGTVGVLFESRGINYGLHMIERRIYSLYVGTERMLEWAVENHESIKEEVARARADIASKGATYEADDVIVLNHKEVPVTKEYNFPYHNMATGEYGGENLTTSNRTVLEADITRARPTAYVIPDGSRWVKEALSVLDKHSIRYYRVDNGATINLQQYKGDENGAELLAETAVTFPDGAWILPMDQVEGTVLALLMEPDVIDNNEYNCTLVKCGVILPSADGTLPIYRYVHDLEDDGTVAVDMDAVDTKRDVHGEGWTAITSAYEITQSGNYYLDADITGSVKVGSSGSEYGIAISADNVTLCLHGYSIETKGLVGALRSAGTNVTLCNCTLAGGKINNTAIRSVLVTGGSLTMEDNVHVDNAVTTTTGSNPVSAVQVNDAAAFTMNGGTIRNNDLTRSASGQNVGAIVALGTANVTLTGGKISGNVMTNVGTAAAVTIDKGVLTISGTAAIEDNLLEADSGAVVVVSQSGGSISMTGGSILGNKGACASGVKITSGTTFTMSGGLIFGNTGASDGGGVNVSGGTFTMSGTAEIRGNKAAINGGGVYVAKGAVFNMNGGTISENTQTTTNSGGGGGVLSYGTVTMTDGTIKDNISKNNGGGIYVWEGTFDMEGGTISGNSAGMYGGGVMIRAARFTLDGGTVRANTLGHDKVYGTQVCVGSNSSNSAVGKTFFVMESGTIDAGGTAKRDVSVLGGEATIVDGSVTGAVDVIGAVGNEARLAVQGGSITGTVTNGTTALPTGTSRGKCTTTITGGKFSQSPSAFVAGGYKVTDSGDSALPYTVVADVPDPTVCALHGDHDGWTAVDNSRSTSITAGGNYYLTGDITTARGGTTTGALNFAGESSSTEFTLCLNGHSILIAGTTQGVMSAVRIEKGHLTIVNGIKPEPDKDGNPTSGLITGSGSYTNKDGAAQTNGRSFQIGTNDSIKDSVTICDNVHVNGLSTTGAPIYMFSDGILNVEGGTISNNSGGSGYGGAIRMAGQMTMSGGTISNNTTSGNGGAVLVCQDGSHPAGTFTMTGGTISGNTAKLGGGVYVAEAGTFTMSGGTISGNSATTSDSGKGGGGVYVAGAFTMSDDAKISGNTVSVGGGGVNVAAGATFDMTGGTISGNKHTGSSGGGGGVLNHGTFTMSGGTITGNSNKSNGGGVYHWEGTFTMTGGTISGNTGATWAAGVMVRLGTFTMKGGTISGNNTPYGAQVCVGVNKSSSGTFVLEGGTIDSDGVEASDVTVLRGTATIKGGTVIGNLGTMGVQGAEASLAIQGGSIIGTLTNELEMPANTGSRGKCTITVTGGKFGDDMTRDALAAFLPAESDAMTTVYSVADYDDPTGTLAYQAGVGLYSEVEDKFMDFGSSLDFGVILNAHRNFNLSDFAEGFTVSAVSDNKTYGASFDTATVPGSLILMAHGIAAKEMHDAITFTVKKGDAVWFEQTLSVYDVAKLWHGDADTSDQRMLADMIAYGNEARKEFDYNMTAQTQLSTLTGGTAHIPAWKATQDAGVTNGQESNVAVTLSLKDQIELNIYINDAAAQISGVKLDGEDYAADNYTVDTSSGKYTRICFHNIPVVQVKDAVEFAVTFNGENFEMKYSIVDYSIMAKDGGQKDLIRSLMRYVDSVRVYLGVEEEEDIPTLVAPGEDESAIISPWQG